MAEKTSLAQSPATPTLQALVNELASVENWHLLGVNLGLQGHQLRAIERNYPHDNDRLKTETLDFWQRNAKSATWEAVAQALCLMGEHVVADAIRRKYCCSSATTDPALVQQSMRSLDTSIVPSSDSSSSAMGSQVMTKATIPPHTDDSLVLAKKNLQKIKDKFAPLIALADRVLQRKDINISNFHLFLIAQYLPEEDDNDTRAIDPSKFVSEVLGTAKSVSETLRSLLVHRLLSYKNFDVLRSIISHYASDDIEMKTKLDEYEQELAGYVLVTKMKDYLNAEIQQSELSEPDPELLHAISVKVKANVTEKTLKYVSELQDSLAYQVKLPVTAVLFHKIAKGCVEITWLLPCHLTEFTRRRLQESTDYFQQENILRVTIAGRCVYQELPPLQESPRKQEIDSGRKGDPDDPDDQDIGNLSSAQDLPDAENLSSLRRFEQLTDDEPEGPEDIQDYQQGMRCGRVVCLNYSLLYGQLDPEKLLSKLSEKDLIDEKDLQLAESFHQRFAKNVVVIRALLWYDRPSHGLLKFCDTLETTPGQEHLGRKLLKDYKHQSPVHVQSPSANTAVHSNLSETSEMFQQLQREVMDFLDHFPNALAKLKQVLASLVLPIGSGKVVPLVDPLAYENTQTVRELFRLMAPYWNPLSTDLLGLLLEASGCKQAASKVAEYVEAKVSKSHLVICIRQLPALASGESDLNVDDLKAVHTTLLSHLQSLHPAVFAQLPEHKVTSTRRVVRISVEVDKPLVCLADYESITTAVSSFLQVPTIALVYAGFSNAPLVLCWLASHHLVDYIKSSRAGYLLSLCTHQLLAENNVTGIAIGEQTYKCPTIKEVKLWEASQYGLVEHVRYLLATGVNVNMATIDGAVALGRASMNGHQDVVDELLRAGANPDIQKKNGCSPLHEACEKGYDWIVDKLLQAGATVDLQTEVVATDSRNQLVLVDNYISLTVMMKDGTTALYLASQNGYHTIVEYLIGAKADVNTPRKNGATALYVASQNGHHKVVEYLIGAKADVNTPMEDGCTPLMIASDRGHPSIVKVLLQAGANINTTMQDGTTALFIASQEGHLSLVERLLAAEADVNHPCENGATPLFIASQKGHFPVVECLLAAEADVNHPSKDGSTALFVASQNGHRTVVEYLIGAKADVNTPREDGQTPLKTASFNGHLKVVELLLGSGANPDLQDKEGYTPLHNASQEGHDGIVEILLQAGASVDLQTKNGVTPLMAASHKGHLSVVKVLLQTGATINTISQGGTALHAAVLGQHEDIVELLLLAKIDPDLPDKVSQMTALMRAAATGNVGIVRKLIHHGASVNLTNKAGQTAFDVANTEGHIDVCQELQAQ